jgi:hypothetical protein
MSDARIAPLEPPYPEAVAAALQRIMSSWFCANAFRLPREPYGARFPER